MISQRVAGDPAVVISLGVVGNGLEGAVEVGERRGAVAPAEPGSAAEVIGFSLFA
jgi:hypothetical protein